MLKYNKRHYPAISQIPIDLDYDLIEDFLLLCIVGSRITCIICCVVIIVGICRRSVICCVIVIVIRVRRG